MDVFIITLTSSDERLNNVLELNKSLTDMGYTVHLVNAVNGHIFGEKDKKILRDKNYFSRELQPGQMGVALTQYFIWEYIRQKNINKAIVLEDDVFIHNDFKNNIESIKRELPDDTDMCYLFHHPWQQQNLYKDENHIKEKKTIIKSVPMYGLVAYIITLKGVNNICKRIKPIYTTIDDMIMQMFSSKVLVNYASKVQLCDTFGEMGILNGRDNSEPEASKNIGDRKLLTSTVKPRNMDFMKEIENKKIPFDVNGIKMLQPKIFLGKIKFMTIDMKDCRISQFKAC